MTIASFQARCGPSRRLSLDFDDSGPLQWLCASERHWQSQEENTHLMENTSNHQNLGRALMEVNNTPVGSGRFRDHAQDPIGVLGMSFSSSLALSYEDCVAHTHGGEHDRYEVILLAQRGCLWQQARKAHAMRNELLT